MSDEIITCGACGSQHPITDLFCIICGIAIANINKSKKKITIEQLYTKPAAVRGSVTNE